MKTWASSCRRSAALLRSPFRRLLKLSFMLLARFLNVIWSPHPSTVFMFLYCASAYISRWIQDRTVFYIFKYLIYPNIIRRSRLSSPFSRWHALLLFIYRSGTVACNIVGVNTINQAGSRAGSLTTLHLIPLLFTNRLSFAADSLGLSLHNYLSLHTLVGLMALVQSLIHTVIFFGHNPMNLRENFASLIPLSLFRTSLFELFQKAHYALAILTAYVVWRHLSLCSTSSRIYIIVAGCIFALSTIVRYSRLLLRNIVWKQRYANTNVVQASDAIRIRVTIPRPWRVRAGEYIYIWMPGASFWSPFQSHPFIISWWDNNVDGKSTTIYLLV